MKTTTVRLVLRPLRRMRHLTEIAIHADRRAVARKAQLILHEHPSFLKVARRRSFLINMQSSLRDIEVRLHCGLSWLN